MTRSWRQSGVTGMQNRQWLRRSRKPRRSSRLGVLRTTQMQFGTPATMEKIRRKLNSLGQFEIQVSQRRR